MHTPDAHEGSCLCGHISFKVKAILAPPQACSCGKCRKWSGALSVEWVNVSLADIEWTKGVRPHPFRMSEKAVRGNCPKCGSALCTLQDRAETISIVLGSFDQPGVLLSEQHNDQMVA